VFYKVGQCTGISGYERVPQGQIYFAGEHTSLRYRGYMEDGAQTGLEAALALLAVLR
jgi:monoamine oxidase